MSDRKQPLEGQPFLWSRQSPKHAAQNLAQVVIATQRLKQDRAIVKHCIIHTLRGVGMASNFVNGSSDKGSPNRGVKDLEHKAGKREKEHMPSADRTQRGRLLSAENVTHLSGFSRASLNAFIHRAAVAPSTIR